MAANGQLVFTDVDKVTFKGVGDTSNAVIDTTTGKIGVGVDSPDANLHVLGNCFVSTNFELGGTMTMGTVTVRAQHELSAITATGNTTPHTVEFQNAETGLVTTGNVSVGKELTVAGNVAVDTDTLFVDSVNNRVGVGTSTPDETLSIYKEDTTAAGETVISSMTGIFSGSDATGGNINNTGLFINLDSSATGGTATNTEEHRVWGIDVDIDVTGDSDDIRGGRFLVRSGLAENGTDTNTNIYGIDAQGQHNGTAPSANIIGVNARSFKGTSSTGLTNKMVAVSAENEINVGTCTDVYGVRVQFDRNGGAATNSYLFYGGHLGSSTTITNNYGLYVTGTDKHYLEGNVGIGTDTPGSKLDVNGGIIGQTGVFSGNLTAGTIGGDGAGITGTVGDTSGVKAVYFENTENDDNHYTDKNGMLVFDENFLDTEYGTGTYDPSSTFVGGDGGGLLIKNQDGWGAIFTSVNTQWAKGYWNSLDVSGDVTASSFTTSGLTASTFLGVTPGFQSEFIYTRGLVNQSETGTGPAAIIFGNGSTSGNDQISLITSGNTRLYINSAGSVTLGNGTAVTSDDRIKFNEENISNALVLIDRIKPQKYEKIACVSVPQYRGTWIPTNEEWENVKEDYEYNDEFGFIAQDVRNVPELAFLVKGEETRIDTMTLAPEEYSNLAAEEQETYTQTLDGYTKQIETQTPLSLNYQGLFVVAIGAIQELKAENDSIKARLDALENA